jgi:hypothetical protein
MAECVEFESKEGLKAFMESYSLEVKNMTKEEKLQEYKTLKDQFVALQTIDNSGLPVLEVVWGFIPCGNLYCATNMSGYESDEDQKAAQLGSIGVLIHNMFSENKLPYSPYYETHKACFETVLAEMWVLGKEF